MSVSGHVVRESTKEEACIIELGEELGLSISDLKGSELEWIAAYENYEEYPEKNLYNLEWHDVFTTTIPTLTLEKISFSDKEVVGLYLCPFSELETLLQQQYLPLTGGLKHSLPFFM